VKTVKSRLRIVRGRGASIETVGIKAISVDIMLNNENMALVYFGLSKKYPKIILPLHKSVLLPCQNL
jgi:hypothetical protein